MKEAMVRRRLAVCIALVGTGCAFDDGLPEEASIEEVGEVSSSLFVNEPCPAGTECFDRTDSTGSIRTRVYRCSWSAASGTPSATCSVGSAFALVGGGAEVLGAEHPGQLLIKSAPTGNQSDTWEVKSKHHVYSETTLRVRAYAIGLQLNNMTKATLKSQIKYNFTQMAGTNSFPAVAFGVPANEVLLSGGASATGGANGQLLVHSFPSGAHLWASYSKEHLVAAPGTIAQFALSMPVCPAGFSADPFCVTRSVFMAESGTGTGYRSSSVGLADSSWVMTGVGAISFTSNGENGVTNGGRPLTDLFPSGASSAFATTKDHGVSTSGSTQVFLNAVRRL